MRRLVFIAFAVVSVVFSNVSVVSAISQTQKNIIDSGILFYNYDEVYACGNTTTPQAKINSAYILGDSITVQSQNEINTAFADASITTTINAISGRAISVDTTGTNKQTGLEAVDADKSILASSDAIVVALGTNSGTEDLTVQIPALIEKIREANQTIEIFWVNLFYNGTSVNERNNVIAELSSSSALNYTIIDAKSAEIPLEDGTHPTVEGRSIFATTIANALKTTTVSNPTGNNVSGEVKPIVGGTSLDGNQAHILSYLDGIDEAKAANAINVYIQQKKPDSPFVGLGESFVQGGKKYNVNPFLPVGHLEKENGFATAEGGWHDPSTLYATEEAARAGDTSQLGAESHNAFGREGSSSQPRVYYRTSSGRIRTPFQWSSWAASLDGNNGQEDPWFALINRRYLAQGDGSFNIASGDFATYISKYAPQSDGNNEANYVAGLKDVIDELVALMGSGITFSGSTNTGDCGPEGLRAGANGWGLPGEANPMIYYSQLREASSPRDPAVTSYWGEYPYGEGTIAECGCGPTSFAMIVATLKNDPSVTPERVATWAAENGYRSGDADCAGSAWWWVGTEAQQQNTLETWGVRSRQITLDEAKSEIQQGNLIMVSVGPGSPFLSEGGNGHLLVMRAFTDDGKYLFADPSDSTSKRNNGGDGAEGIDPNIFNGNPPGSSHTPIEASIVSQGLKGLFVIENAADGVR